MPTVIGDSFARSVPRSVGHVSCVWEERKCGLGMAPVSPASKATLNASRAKMI
jgi:hypothetical protein